jgi:NAD(P)-dependent dehydrogenase (short-subunit alcohol dehydrogenase family)
MMQLKPVEEQVAAVMGASSGIGRETALQFAERAPRWLSRPGASPGSTRWWKRYEGRAAKRRPWSPR